MASVGRTAETLLDLSMVVGGILRCTLFLPIERVSCSSTYASFDLRDSTCLDSLGALLRHHLA